MTRSDHYLQITSNWNKTKNNSLFKLARAVTIERLNIYFCIYLDTLIFFYKWQLQLIIVYTCIEYTYMVK